MSARTLTHESTNYESRVCVQLVVYFFPALQTTQTACKCSMWWREAFIYQRLINALLFLPEKPFWILETTTWAHERTEASLLVTVAEPYRVFEPRYDYYACHSQLLCPFARLSHDDLLCLSCNPLWCLERSLKFMYSIIVNATEEVGDSSSSTNLASFPHLLAHFPCERRLPRSSVIRDSRFVIPSPRDIALPQYSHS